MNIDFQQGILTYPSKYGRQTFLSAAGAYVSLRTTDGDVTITLAHGSNNYLFTESADVDNAWGPLQLNTDYWLYWDIDPLTAVRTFGTTLIQPNFGPTEQRPTASLDVHWFDTTTKKMYVYQTDGWREVIRVFAAKVNNAVFTGLGNGIIGNTFSGTQVGIKVQGLTAEYVTFDDAGLPIRTMDGQFFTSATPSIVNGLPIETVRLESIPVNGIATSAISAFQAVKYTNFDYVGPASYNDIQNTTIALTVNNLTSGQVGSLCLQGTITNPSWNFQQVGAPLWITNSGVLTETDPHIADSIQFPIAKSPVARVISSTSIYFSVGMGGAGMTGDSGEPVPQASTSVYGIGRLSVPAINPLNPIAVGDNDPRLIPYVHPATHPATIVTTTAYKFLTGTTAQTQLHQLADRSLGSLGDVNVPAPVIGHGLSWNGTTWVDTQFTRVQYLSQISDVSFPTAPVSGQTLTFGGQTWNNVAQSLAFTGDITGTGIRDSTGNLSINTSLKNVNATPGLYGGTNIALTFTVNAKGLITSSGSVPIAVPNAITANLYGCGDNTINAVGDGSNSSRSLLVQIGTTSDWAQVSSDTHNMAIKNDGSLWGWGNNSVGQIGNSTTAYISSPIQIGTLTTWKFVTTGQWSTFAIQTDGTLWTWGSNYAGGLGDGTTASRSSPVQVGALTDWKYVSVGGYSVLAVKTDGTLWAWGFNGSFQLGFADVTHRSSPAQVGSLTDWATVECCGVASIALKNDGSRWGWGVNNNGELGNNTINALITPTQISGPENWRHVSAGNSFYIATKTDNTLWAWGHNISGQLGDGTTVSKSSPVQIGSLTNWSNVFAGNQHVLAIKTDKSAWTWGENSSGQLADGTVAPKSSPVQVGSLTDWQTGTAGQTNTFLVKLTHNGTVMSIDGSGGTTGLTLSGGPITTSGTLTLGGTLSIANGGTNATTANSAFNNLVPPQTGQSGSFLTTDGSNTSWAAIAPFQLYTWGGNGHGQLGIIPLPVVVSGPLQVGTYTDWQTISVGQSFTAGIRRDGSLWTWGLNDSGQLGDGTIVDKSSPIQIGALTDWKQVSCGYHHTEAVKTDGTLWAWGENNFAYLGDGTLVPKSSPIQIGALTNWNSVDAGPNHTIGIKTDGTMWVWGYEVVYGELGTPIPGANASSPTQIGTDTNWKQGSVGSNHTAVVKTDGTLWTWGNNTSGQLGLGTTTVSSVPIQVGSLTTWNYAACGGDSTAAIMKDGTLWVWGSNLLGKLGLDDTTNRSSPVQVGSLNNWARVEIGAYNMLAIKTDGTMWTWGFDNYSGSPLRSSPLQVGTSMAWRFASTCASTNMAAIQTNSAPLPISLGGTGQFTASAAINALMPSQQGHAGKALTYDGSMFRWLTASGV